jgi:hypothetical protein
MQKKQASNCQKSQVTAPNVPDAKTALPKKRKEDAKKTLYINRI